MLVLVNIMLVLGVQCLRLIQPNLNYKNARSLTFFFVITIVNNSHDSALFISNNFNRLL